MFAIAGPIELLIDIPLFRMQTTLSKLYSTCIVENFKEYEGEKITAMFFNQFTRSMAIMPLKLKGSERE